MSVEKDQPKYSEYIVTMRSRTTAGVDTDNIRVFSGQVVSEVASRVADSWGADVVEITRPDGTIYDPGKEELERVYEFPNGFREQAEGMYKWLRHEGFTPSWALGVREDGDYHNDIALPIKEVPALRELQKIHPARWGNHPDVAAALASSTTLVQKQQSVAEGLRNYVVLVISNTSNAAFAESGREQEVGRIINVAAKKASSASIIGEFDFSLRDANGNRVGNVSHGRTEPHDDITGGTVRLWIDTSNAAFDDHLGTEVARILSVAANRVIEGENSFILRDINGNSVGRFEFAEEPSLADENSVDILKALQSDNVYRVDGGYSAIGDDEFCFIIPAPGFEVGYHQDEGDAWLVNAAGEKAPGYEEPQRVRELDFRRLTFDEKNELRNYDPANKKANTDVDSLDDDQVDDGVSPS